MESFAQIFREHAPYAWRVLRRLGVREAEVDDLVQEVFVVVHRKLPEFERRSSIRTWIYGICVRVASDHRRRAHVRREHPTDLPPERAGSAPQLREIEQRQALAQLDEALSELSDDKRAVFVLFEVEQLPMDEVARAVGCPVKTAYSRLYAARDHVKTSFAALEPALAPAREDRPSEQRLAAIAAGLGPLFESAGAAGAAAGASIAIKAAGAGAAALAGIVAVVGVVAYSGSDDRARSPSSTIEVAARPAVDDRRPAEAETRTETEAAPETDAVPAIAPEATAQPAAAAERPRRSPEPVAEPEAPQRSELELLTDAQDALDRDPRRALDLASEHARTHANGMLAQEREVLAIDALLRLGRRADAEQRAEAFTTRWPRSAQARRIATLLARAR